MIVMGLDVSTTSTGYSVFRNKNLIAYGLISPKLDEDIYTRMVYTINEINILFAKHKVGFIGVEDMVFARSRNTKTAKDIFQLVSMICGVATLKGISWKLLYPSEWRKISGIYNSKIKSLKREFQKERAVELCNELFDLKLEWKSDLNDKKTHHSDIAEAVLIGKSIIDIIT